MSSQPSDKPLIEHYRHSLNNLLELYPTLENDFHTSLKKEHQQQVIKNDARLNELKRGFLDFLQHKDNNAARIIDELQRYCMGTDDERSEFDKFINDAKNLCSDISATKEDMLQPFSLYVIGAGKAGKSTLINALVGEDVATVGVLPKTWKVDRFFDADTKQAIIHYKDGTPSTVTSQINATTLVHEEEEKRKHSEKEILKKRREHYRLYPNLSLEEKEGVTNNLNDLYLYRSAIRQIEWAIDIKNINNSILKKFSIIDTPGVGQNHAGKDIVSDIGEDITAFSQADGMIWVLDATTLAAATPEALLRDLEEHSVGITTTHKIAVLNRIDVIRNATGDDGVKKVEQAAQKILGNHFSTIIPFSAKEACDGLLSNDNGKLHDSGYYRLFEVINTLFSKQSANRISQKSDRLNHILQYKYDRDLQPYIKRLAADERSLYDGYRSLQESLQDLQIDLDNAKLNFLDAYQTDININIDTNAASYLDIIEERERNIFLNDYIFKTEMMQQNLNPLLISNQQYVADFVIGQKKSNQKTFKRFKHLNEALYPMAIALDDKESRALTMSASDISFGSEDETSMLIGGGLAVAGMILLGPIGLLAGAADVFFGFSKGRKINAAKTKLTKHLQENIIKPTSEQIETVFNKLLSNADNEVRASASQMFGQLHFEPKPEYFNQVRHLITALQQELAQPYTIRQQALPDDSIELTPSLSLYLLRQSHANKA